MKVWRPAHRIRCQSCPRTARWFWLGARWCDRHVPRWVKR